MANVMINRLGLSVAGDRVVLNLGERTGNIWMARTEEKL
jgi:hypothetical protein